jgi:hypothetical protein
MKKHSKRFDQLPISRYHLMFKVYVSIPSSIVYLFISFTFQYLDEFSQALAAEVRMLLGEVGKIREERRALQQYV